MVKIVAHRGASATHTENTIEAFTAARDQGADGIELDVRLSSDEVLMVHHDAHLADGRLLRSLTAEEMPDSVPTLGDALEVVDGMWLNVEIKNVPDEPDFDDQHVISLAVAGLLAAHMIDGMDGNLMVSSFNVDSIERIKKHDPRVPLALLVWGQIDPASLIARAAAHGFAAIHPQDLLVDKAFVERAGEAGLEVNVWTVDDPDRIVQLAELGVAGIITNKPNVAYQALEGAGLR